jgi:hypothetical protein
MNGRVCVRAYIGPISMVVTIFEFANELIELIIEVTPSAILAQAVRSPRCRELWPIFGQALLATMLANIESTIVQHVEALLQEQHVSGTWHHILNNTTSTRPKECGGPTFPSLTALKQSTMVAPGLHTCTICLPCSFESRDGEELAVSATATSHKQAAEAACLRAFATLLVKDMSKVLLRQTHWRCEVVELVAGISAITGGTRQPLAAQGPCPSRQGETHEQDVLDLLRAILQNEGGIADPSRLRTFSDGTKPYLRLGEMLARDTLLHFLQAHSEEFEMLPHGPDRKGFKFRAAPTAGVRAKAISAHKGYAPGSASTHQGYAPGSVNADKGYAPGSASTHQGYAEERTSVVADMAKLMLGPPGQTKRHKISEPMCKHKAVDQTGKPWPRRGTQGKGIAGSSHVDPNNLDDIGSSMDSTLFRSNKQGWDESWQHLLENRHDFEYIYMNTTGGYRGFEATCMHCQCSCILSWDKHSSEETLDTNRTKWLSFFCHTPLPSSASKPTV